MSEETIINNIKPLVQAVNNKQQELKNNDDSSKLTAFINIVEKKPDIVFPLGKPNNHKEQIDALKKFKNGQMSYGEMRSRCG